MGPRARGKGGGSKEGSGGRGGGREKGRGEVAFAVPAVARLTEIGDTSKYRQCWYVGQASDTTAVSASQTLCAPTTERQCRHTALF